MFKFDYQQTKDYIWDWVFDKHYGYPRGQKHLPTPTDKLRDPTYKAPKFAIGHRQVTICPECEFPTLVRMPVKATNIGNFDPIIVTSPIRPHCFSCGWNGPNAYWQKPWPMDENAPVDGWSDIQEGSLIEGVRMNTYAVNPEDLVHGA